MFKSIKIKFILSYMLLIFVSMAFTGFFFQRWMKEYLEENLRNQLATQSRTFADIIYSGMSGPDDFPQRARVIAGDYLSDQNQRLQIFDPQGNRIADSWEGEDDHQIPPDRLKSILEGKETDWVWVKKGGRIQNCAFPIKMFSGGNMGVVVLSTPLSKIDRTFERLIHLLWLAILISLGFSFFLSVALAQTLTNPIAGMKKVTARIAEGEFDLSVDYRGRDELKSLADTINYMSGQIKKNIAEITGEKNKMNALLSALPDGVIALDTQERVLFMNSSAGHYISLKPEEIIHKNLFELWQVEEVRDFYREGRTKTGLFSREITIPPRILKLYTVPFADSQSAISGMMLIIRDITDIRRLEETRTHFLGSISHELRTPLTIIKGWIYTVKDEPHVVEHEETRHALEIIDQETDRLTRLVNDLLELSRLRSKKLSLEMETVNPDKILKDTFVQMLPNAQRMGLQLLLNTTADNTELTGDKDRLKQVFINLIDNAIKYTPSGGRVEVSSHREDHCWTFQVQDNGMGIPKDELPFLFERFFRTKDKNKKKYIKGTGLGMAIVKEIVDSHGGKIRVSSKEKEGTAIRVELPLTPPEAEDKAND